MTVSSRKMYTLKLREGNVDRTSWVKTLGLAESNSAEMKWKKMFSGQEACLRAEWTAAMEPRRYSESSVMATWTKDGSHDDVSLLTDTGQSLPLRYSGASVNRSNPKKSPLSIDRDGIERIPRQNGANSTSNTATYCRKPTIIYFSFSVFPSFLNKKRILGSLKANKGNGVIGYQ